MLTYEQLDFIADSYIPILALASLAFGIKQYKEALRRNLLCLPSSVGIAYGFMYIDALLQLWPSVGLDYSTHTAVALLFVVNLSFVSQRVLQTAVGSLIAYCGLMVYQRYHTVLDIISTIAVLLPLFYLIYARIGNGHSKEK